MAPTHSHAPLGFPRSRSPSPAPAPPQLATTRSTTPAPAPAQGAAHHRPAFVHASTSFGAAGRLPPSVNASASASLSGGSVAGTRVASREGTPANTISRGSGKGSSSSYTDEAEEEYPPSKEAGSSAFYPPDHSHGHAHANGRSHAHLAYLQPGGYSPYTPYVQQNDPSRGLYAHRRAPLAFGEGGADAERGAGAGGKWCGASGGCGREGGGLGRAMVAGWVITTLGFLMAIGFWKGELFQALDDMSKYLSEQGFYGHLTFFLLILLTTIPPLPLYSTLIVLAGYTFGVWEGFVISYLASLVGAVGVFVVSRRVLKDVIVKCLSSSPTSISILSILPKQPHLLLLIRVAPYPYNLLNVILASSPTLSLRTYTGCTAISLCKLVLHTWIGSGIHDLSASYGRSHGSVGVAPSDGDSEDAYPGGTTGDAVKGQWPPFTHHHPTHGAHSASADGSDNSEDIRTVSTWAGIVLCVALFFYLTHIAKKAVAKAQMEQAEQDEREREEREGLVAGGEGGAVEMGEERTMV
ncbi:hypothetical protein IAT38_003544 [Cryptococcus sp. DSM 104549]